MPKKCVVCGQTILKEEEEYCTPYKNRLAHTECFNTAMKLIKEGKDEELEKKKKQIETKSKINGRKKTVKTPKAELKDGLSDEEYKEKRDFYDYLKGLLDIEKLGAKVYVLSEKYVEQYEEMNWVGMKNTLVYLNEIINLPLKGDIVGIIPFYYSEAADFFKEVKTVEENNKDKDIKKLYSERVVRIKPPKNTRVVKQLNFDD